MCLGLVESGIASLLLETAEAALLLAKAALVAKVALAAEAALLLTEAALVAKVAAALLSISVVVVLTEGLADVELALLEDKLLLALGQHLHGVLLVVVGDEAVALRVAHRVRDDARVLDAPEVGKIVAQFVLRGLI